MGADDHVNAAEKVYNAKWKFTYSNDHYFKTRYPNESYNSSIFVSPLSSLNTKFQSSANPN
jgi:hypothetical protein